MIAIRPAAIFLGVTLSLSVVSAVEAGDWLAHLRSPDFRTRLEAAFDYKLLPPDPEGRWHTLSEGLDDEEPSIRAYSAAAVGELLVAPEPAVPRLVALLADPEEAVAEHAALALSKIGEPAVVALIEAMTRTIPDPAPGTLSDPERRETYVRAMRDTGYAAASIVLIGATAAPFLIERSQDLLDRTEAIPPERGAADIAALERLLFVLAEIAGTEAVATIAAAFGHASDEVRQAAEMVFTSSRTYAFELPARGEPWTGQTTSLGLDPVTAASLLTSVLADESYPLPVRARAMALLGEKYGGTSEAAAALERYIRRADDALADAATSALESFDDAELIASRFVEDEDPRLRAVAARLLRSLASRHRDRAALRRKALNSGHHELVVAALNSGDRYLGRDDEWYNRAYARTDEPAGRLEILLLIYASGRQIPELDEALVEPLLDSPWIDVRTAAAIWLYRERGRTTPVVAAVRAFTSRTLGGGPNAAKEGWLGIGIIRHDERGLPEFGVRVLPYPNSTLAHRSGIEPDDVILKLADVAIEDANALKRAIGDLDLGAQASLTVQRGDEVLELVATVEEKPGHVHRVERDLVIEMMAEVEDLPLELVPDLQTLARRSSDVASWAVDALSKTPDPGRNLWRLVSDESVAEEFRVDALDAMVGSSSTVWPSGSAVATLIADPRQPQALREAAVRLVATGKLGLSTIINMIDEIDLSDLNRWNLRLDRYFQPGEASDDSILNNEARRAVLTRILDPDGCFPASLFDSLASHAGDWPPDLQDKAEALAFARLVDQEPQWRRSGAHLLGQLRSNAERNVAALERLLADRDAEVQDAARRALFGYGPEARPALDSIVSSLVAPGAPHDGPEPPKTPYQTWMLQPFKVLDPDLSNPALQRLVSDLVTMHVRDLDVASRREQAIFEIRSFGPWAAAAKAKLRSLLDDYEPRVRLSAAMALADIGAAEAEVVPRIEDLVNHDIPWIRGYAGSVVRRWMETPGGVHPTVAIDRYVHELVDRLLAGMPWVPWLGPLSNPCSNCVMEPITPTWLEQRFPWPPPDATAWDSVPTPGLSVLSLEEIRSRLEAVLEERGYSGNGLYGIPDGFVLVTRVERINEDGIAYERSERWSHDRLPMGEITLANWASRLFFEQVGYFRMLVFAVTPDMHPGFSDEVLDEALARRMAHAGFRELPAELAAEPFAGRHIHVLVYEFEKRSGSAHFSRDGWLAAEDHLKQARLLPALAALSSH